MKVEQLDDTIEGFRPIRLSIVIESKEELDELWHRLNAGEDYFKHYMLEQGLSFSSSSFCNTEALWIKIDSILGET